MPTPPEILAVERPKNTIVYVYGKNKDKYAVKQRIGCKYKEGRRLPVTGKTIGHIIDGKYVPKDQPESNERVSNAHVDLKDWANITLCDNLLKPLLEELKKVYAPEDALKIYCISILRVCNPGIKDYELKDAYETSFLSELYPNVGLCKNTVSRFLNDLGKAYSKIVEFMVNRSKNVGIDHHLLIDGTLKSNESSVNSLSDFSRKAVTKGSRDISVLFAFDLEEGELICSKCFPGNMLDLTAYETFISETGIHKGIIVGDKGFPESAARAYFKNNPDLHYLNPIKRNSKTIAQNNLFSYDGILDGHDNVLFKKVKCPDSDKWLYSFRDSKRAAAEEQDWLKRAKKNGNYNQETLKKKQNTFGTVVLESDMDLSPEQAYKTFESRWEIEVVIRFYKSACHFDETRVHDDYSVIASEFCDFISSVLTFRLINTFDSLKLLHKYTYKKIMSMLVRAKKVFIDGSWKLIKLTKSNSDLLTVLGLI